MAQLVIITHPDQAAGFRLAGVETYPATTAEEARQRLLGLLDDEEVGIIALDQPYLDQVDGRMRRRLDNSVKPVVLGIPATGQEADAVARRQQMVDLIRRAIGVRIAFHTEPTKDTL